METTEFMLITVERVKHLQESEALLTCLENLGIKKWEIYKEAKEMLEQLSSGEFEHE